MKARNVILLGFAALGIWYLPTALALVNLTLRFGKLSIISITSEYIRIGIEVFAGNNSSKSLNMQQANMGVFLNNDYIGTVQNPINQLIPAHSEHPIILTVDLLPSQLGTTIWNAVLSNQLVGFNLKLDGYLIVNAKKFPFNTLYTINDLQDAFTK